MITSADAVIILTQPILFPVPQQIQGFAADDIYDVDAIRAAESSMGVDGFLSFGFVWEAIKQAISLQADSLSNAFFDTITQQQQAAQTVYPLSGIVTLPGIVTKFAMLNGGLTNYKPMPDAKRTLQPRRYEVTWNRVVPAPA